MMKPALLVTVLAASLLVSCSSDPAPEPTSAEKTIGPEGGTMDVAGATITIAPGALPSATKITVSKTTSAAPAGYVALSPIFHCEPSGTEFAKEVTMTMPFTSDGQPATMFWSAGTPEFKDIGGTVEGGRMKATVRHFSEGFVGRKK